MSVYSTITNTVAATYKGTHVGPVVMTARETKTGERLVRTNAKPGDLLVNLNLTAIPREATRAIKVFGPKVAKALAVNAVSTAIALEVIDALENQWEKRVRRDELHKVIQQVATHGPSDQLNQQLLVLSRPDERRTFGQWVKDLPYRTGRRLYRICLVEAGWWTMYLSSPLWVPVVLADLVYSFAVVPFVNFVTRSVLKHEVSLETLMNVRTYTTVPVIKHTLLRGWRWFNKGVDMRVYNRNVTKATISEYPLFEIAKSHAHAQIQTITDGHTAFAWGEALAEYVNDAEKSVEGRQRAYAQVSYWVEDNITPQFRNAVLYGFRTGTPVVYRDLVSV